MLSAMSVLRPSSPLQVVHPHKGGGPQPVLSQVAPAGGPAHVVHVASPYAGHRLVATPSAPLQTLQSALPRELAAKFEQNRRDAESTRKSNTQLPIVASPESATTSPSAPSGLLADGNGCAMRGPPPSPATSSRVQTLSPRHLGSVFQRSPSRPMNRSMKRSVMMEDLDNSRLLDLQMGAKRQMELDQRSASPRRLVVPLHRSHGNSSLGSGLVGGSVGGMAGTPSMGVALRQGGRQMFDKRTLRRRHQDDFRAAIQDWCRQRSAAGGRPRRANGCTVAVRLRPIFDKEVQQHGEFEVVSVSQDWNEVVVHNCLFYADLARMYVHHVGFCFPKVFGPHATNQEVYAECGRAGVAHALSGQLGTLFMFGQTGSGKTYTMSSIMELAGREMFANLERREDAPVSLKAFEVAGKKCFDLLTRQRTELKLLDDQSGRTNICGATEAPVCSADECLRVLRDALGRRATAGHARNDESSRSHCVCILDISSGGSLILVDCAGTERRQDSDQHSTERMRESAEINASLHALKECIRHRCKEQRAAALKEEDQGVIHVPYRDSQLTRVLHESFSRPGSYLAAIGTISPTSMDTEHTLSTLKTLQLLMSESGNSDSPTFEQRVDVQPHFRGSFLRKGSAELKIKRRPGSADPPRVAMLGFPPRSAVRPEQGGGGGAMLRKCGSVEHTACPRTPTMASRTVVENHASIGGVSLPLNGLAGIPPPPAGAPPPPVGPPHAHLSRQAVMPSTDGYTPSDTSSTPASSARRAVGLVPEAARVITEAATVVVATSAPVVSGANGSTSSRTARSDEVRATPRPRILNSQEGFVEDEASAIRSEVASLHARIVHLEGALNSCSASKEATSAKDAAQLRDAIARADQAERRAAELSSKCAALETLFQREQQHRRQVHNQLLDLKGQIRVFCRIRPTLSTNDPGEECATIRKDAFVAEVAKSFTSVEGLPRIERREFQFDAVLGASATQEDVYKEVRDLVQSAVDGYNVTVLAYGQTGAGKTYTMYGGSGEHRGVGPRTIESIFETLERMDADRFSFKVRATLVELYKTDFVDLLSVGQGGSNKLEVRRDVRTGDVTVDNAQEREVKTAEQLLQLLEEGQEHRKVASTQMNADSSRSHLFLSIAIDVLDLETQTTHFGKVRLCDLAGSERPKRSGASGDVMKEAIEINKALTALGDVIETLTRNASSAVVPYRNHKLTQLLSDSLGGSAKTLMIVNVSPAKSDVEESLNSLTYAARARSIVNDPTTTRQHPMHRSTVGIIGIGNQGVITPVHRGICIRQGSPGVIRARRKDESETTFTRARSPTVRGPLAQTVDMAPLERPLPSS